MAEEWGTWECPKCHEELSDPDTIYETVCHENHRVMLGAVEDSGRRQAFLLETR